MIQLHTHLSEQGTQNQSNAKLDFSTEIDTLQESAEGNAQKESELEMESPFNRIIGQCFFPHLYIYINSVDRYNYQFFNSFLNLSPRLITDLYFSNLFELIERFVNDTKAELDREDTTCETSPAIVLSSSADLFLFYKKSLVQCKELSNQQPMLSLANTFQKYLREYATKILQNNLPKYVFEPKFFEANSIL